MGFPSSIYGLCDEVPSMRTGVVWNVADLSRDYSRTWLVELRGGLESGKGFGPIAAASHPLLPLPFAPYTSYNGLEFDELALLIKYEAKPRDEDDWTFWHVTATYSTKMPPGGQFQMPSSGSTAGLPNGGTTPSNNPELEYPDISWTWEELQRASTVDKNRKPYVNSVGQPFTPAYNRPRGYRVLNISRNELNFNATIADGYAYALNDADFLGSPRGFVQCMPPHTTQKFRGQYAYWRVNYKLRFFPRGFMIKYYDTGASGVAEIEQNWQPAIQDQGYCRKGPNGKPTPIKGDNGQNIHQQVLLDGLGQRQTAVDASGLPLPIHILFEEYNYKDMSSLIARGFT